MKMRFVHLGFLFVFFITFAFGGIAPANAQDQITPTPAVISSDQGNVFTFAELGFKERVMVGPYDADRILLSLPPDWQLTTGAAITLKLKFVGGTVSGLDTSSNWLGATLRVSFNNIVLDTILLDHSGEITETFPISAEALATIREDGRYIISFFYDSSFNCDISHLNSSLVISAQSVIDLAHEIAPLVPDLSKLPRPIYQQNSIVKDNTYVVVPDKATATEIQSAFAILTGWGSLTNGEFLSQLIPLGKLTTDLRDSSNIIFVGLPVKLPVLSQAKLPIPSSGGKLVWDGTAADDGFIQIAVSPWNAAKSILYAGGNSEAGVLKAGQAIGAGNVVPTGRLDVSVVSSITTQNLENQIAEDRLFANLGYNNVPLGGVEGQYASFTFSASADQAASTGAYLDLVTSQTALLDYDRSGISVYLNGFVVGGIQYADQTDQVTTTHLEFLPGVLRRGNNLLEIVADLIPVYNCFSPDLSSNTLTIGNTSLIHLPVTEKKIDINNFLSLQYYPSMFIGERNLSDLAFVLPQDDSDSWNLAAHIAYNIGFKGGIPLANTQVVFGDNVPEAVRKERSLIVVGLASDLPVISELKDALPAPFEPGKNEAIQPSLVVNYRLLPDVNVGYLQLFPSPWNPSLSILAVSGNTSDGIPMAAGKLLNDNLLSQLNGNFSILYGDQILSTDTRLGPAKGGLVSNLPVAVAVTPEPTPAQTTALSEPVIIQGRADWILPAVGVISAVILAIVLLMIGNAIWNASQIKRARQTEIKKG